jgi:hypothetical protein
MDAQRAAVVLWRLLQQDEPQLRGWDSAGWVATFIVLPILPFSGFAGRLSCRSFIADD